MIIKIYEEKMKKSIESVENDFDSVRAGRANSAVLNRVMVDYYGTPTPIAADCLHQLSRSPLSGDSAVGCQRGEADQKGHRDL
jgi:ribosome recycling factor